MDAMGKGYYIKMKGYYYNVCMECVRMHAQCAKKRQEPIKEKNYLLKIFLKNLMVQNK